jgi:menaquinone-dependent protoporphyrinogen oxidase
VKVLVSAASRHGATVEIAATIGAALAAAGHQVAVLAPDDVQSLDGYEAAVIGSGVYMGRWLEPAKDLVARHKVALCLIPSWLFSSGPVGDPPKPAEDSVDGTSLAALVGARAHRTFPGVILRERLGFGEKAITSAVRAAEGDFRPWIEIEAWAAEISAALLDAPTVA